MTEFRGGRQEPPPSQEQQRGRPGTRRPPDYYGTLGVPRTATLEEIKKTYRRLARELHPDHNPGNREAEERFKAVSVAYNILSDARKRREYDEHSDLLGAWGDVRTHGAEPGSRSQDSTFDSFGYDFSPPPRYTRSKPGDYQQAREEFIKMMKSKGLDPYEFLDLLKNTPPARGRSRKSKASAGRPPRMQTPKPPKEETKRPMSKEEEQRLRREKIDKQASETRDRILKEARDRMEKAKAKLYEQYPNQYGVGGEFQEKLRKLLDTYDEETRKAYKQYERRYFQKPTPELVSMAGEIEKLVWDKLSSVRVYVEGSHTFSLPKNRGYLHTSIDTTYKTKGMTAVRDEVHTIIEIISPDPDEKGVYVSTGTKIVKKDESGEIWLQRVSGRYNRYSHTSSIFIPETGREPSVILTDKPIRKSDLREMSRLLQHLS